MKDTGKGRMLFALLILTAIAAALVLGVCFGMDIMAARIGLRVFG